MTLLGIKFDPKPVTIIILTTLLLTFDHYRTITPFKALDRLILYFVIPLVVILLAFRQSPAEYGLRLGNWRAGIKWALIGMALVALPIWYLGHTPAFQDYYGGQNIQLLPLLGETIGQLLGWEFMFRGFLLFGLATVAGPYAIFLQAVPFALAHLGKPEAETWTTIFGGALFGFVAWDTRSFLYPFLIHAFIFVFTLLVSTRVLG